MILATQTKFILKQWYWINKFWGILFSDEPVLAKYCGNMWKHVETPYYINGIFLLVYPISRQIEERSKKGLFQYVGCLGILSIHDGRTSMGEDYCHAWGNPQLNRLLGKHQYQSSIRVSFQTWIFLGWWWSVIKSSGRGPAMFGRVDVSPCFTQPWSPETGPGLHDTSKVHPMLSQTEVPNLILSVIAVIIILNDVKSCCRRLSSELWTDHIEPLWGYAGTFPHGENEATQKQGE